MGAEYVSDHNQVGLNVVHCETEHGQVLAGKKITTLTIFGQKTSVQMTLDILVLEIEFCLKRSSPGEGGSWRGGPRCKGGIASEDCAFPPPWNLQIVSRYFRFPKFTSSVVRYFSGYILISKSYHLFSCEIFLSIFFISKINHPFLCEIFLSICFYFKN